MRLRPVAWLFVVLSGAAAGLAPTPAAQAPTSPKLVVLIMVDQMRADYVDRFEQDWTGGLKRLVTGGAWFQRAAYPYLNTVTCAGHATVSTGTFPRRHGVIQNTWWDREASAQMACTTDRNAKPVGYGSTPSGGDSAYRLMVPTFTDVMRTERRANVVTLSLKDRSAVMLAGHGANAVTWLSPNGDRWMTSSAFATAPVPAVRAFLEQNPINADYGKVWNRLLPVGRYRQPDDGEGETPPSGWTRTFPHVLNGRGSGPDASYHAQWQRSPYADAYLGRFAAALVESMQLGRYDGTDVLAVSFSSMDLVGHAFGPNSHEVQDMHAHLDRTLATLLDRLDTLVGRDQYVVGLSADHGVTALPEQMIKAGQDAGRISAVTLAALIDTRVQAALGPGRYVSRVSGNDVYFEPGMYDRLSANPTAMNTVIEALKTTRGIAAAFPSERVRGAENAADPLLRAAALSYFPGRSGDLILALKPGWIQASVGATHGSANPDDQRVPVVLYGRGVRPGRYQDRVTPADIVPTLAALSGLTMQNVDGQVLKMALDTR